MNGGQVLSVDGLGSVVVPPPVLPPPVLPPPVPPPPEGLCSIGLAATQLLPSSAFVKPSLHLKPQIPAPTFPAVVQVLSEFAGGSLQGVPFGLGFSGLSQPQPFVLAIRRPYPGDAQSVELYSLFSIPGATLILWQLLPSAESSASLVHVMIHLDRKSVV